ncbi:hypothetical protein [Gymnodinialimonas sp.]
MVIFDPDQWDVLLRHFETALLYGIVPIVAIALIVALLCGVTGSWRLMRFAFFFAVLGAGFGLLLGASRAPAVNAFLPALITLIGGLVIYAFPKENPAMSLLADPGETPEPQIVRQFVLVALASLVMSSVAGANFGSSVRADHEAFLREEARDLLLYETIELPIELEQIRRALNLSD